MCRHRCLWHATQDCIALHVNHILHRNQFWVISIASGSVRLWDLRSCCKVLSHMMRGILVVSSSPWEGEPTGSSWHLRCCPYMQFAQKDSGDVIGLLQWVWVVPLASRHHRFEQIGAVWYPFQCVHWQLQTMHTHTHYAHSLTALCQWPKTNTEVLNFGVK